MAKRNCEANFGIGNCVRLSLSWLPKCKNGYRDWFGNSCKNFNIDCQAYGFKTIPSVGSFCLKERLYIVPKQLVCPAGTEINGLSCYKPCREGY